MRYAPATPFPSYAYRPGRAPHPRRDAAGHSFGRPDPTPPYVPPDRWRENEAYLFGVDLFNHGYWWESHELWEALWLQSEGAEAQFLQGLIQVAAANIQRDLGKPDGPRRLAAEAIERLERAGDLMGLRVGDFVDGVRACHLEGRAEPPRIRLS